MSNEQGHGLSALAQQPAFGSQVTTPSARDIVRGSQVPLQSGMTGPREMQSLHGIARSLGDRQSGLDPRNYAAGSQNSNLAMQSFEEPLGELGLRDNFGMQTTFYSDPSVPIAHGISTRVQHHGSSVPSLVYNHSGFDTTNTQEQVRANQSGIRAHLREAAAHPPPPTADPSQIQAQHPHLSHDEASAISTMTGPLRHTLTFGQNRWEQNATPLPPSHQNDTDDDNTDMDL